VGEGEVTGIAPRTRLPRAERERQVLEAARALFAERGYGAVTMGGVAAAVGVTKPLLYTYFGNKERLYLACMEPAARDLRDAVAGAVAEADRPADALELGVQAFFEFVDRDRDAWRVLFDETLPAGGEIARRVAEHRERLEAVVAGLVVARLPRGRRGRAAVEAEALSTALLGAAESLARWWLRTGALTAGQAAELLIDTVEPGLRARTTGEAR
jgi:AcrR family transcriptional regulator